MVEIMGKARNEDELVEDVQAAGEGEASEGTVLGGGTELDGGVVESMEVSVPADVLRLLALGDLLKPQPAPVINEELSQSVTDHLSGQLIWAARRDLERDQRKAAGVYLENVIALKRRRAAGIDTYGTELTTHNGRNALADAYQEALDGQLYACQHGMELESALEHAQALGAGAAIAYINERWRTVVEVEACFARAMCLLMTLQASKLKPEQEIPAPAEQDLAPQEDQLQEGGEPQPKPKPLDMEADRLDVDGDLGPAHTESSSPSRSQAHQAAPGFALDTSDEQPGEEAGDHLWSYEENDANTSLGLFDTPDEAAKEWAWEKREDVSERELVLYRWRRKSREEYREQARKLLDFEEWGFAISDAFDEAHGYEVEYDYTPTPDLYDRIAQVVADEWHDQRIYDDATEHDARSVCADFDAILAEDDAKRAQEAAAEAAESIERAHGRDDGEEGDA